MRSLLRGLVVLVNMALVITKNTPICQGGWKNIHDSLTGKNTCLQINFAKKSWIEAEIHCSDSISNLIALDRVNDMLWNTFLQMNSSIWSGMYIEGGRLMWDDYGPRYVYHDSNRMWRWAENDPNPENGQCGRLNSRILNGGREIVEVALHNCSSGLPFICQKDPIEPILSNASFCDDGWIGHTYIPYCYRMLHDSLPYEGTQKTCTAHNGTLANVYSYYTWMLLRSVVDYYSTDSPDYIEKIWIKKTIGRVADCEAFDLGSGSWETLTCETSLSFICMKSTVYKGDVQFNITQMKIGTMESDDPFARLPLHASFNRGIADGEIAFINTPTHILNSTGKFNQEMNGLYYHVEVGTTYVDVVLPLPLFHSGQADRANIEGPINDHTLAIPKKGQVNSSSNHQNYTYIQLTTGYYSFGVYTINPPRRYVHSPNTLFRYSDSNLYIYHVSIALKPSATELLSNMDINVFNLLKDNSSLHFLNKSLSFLSESPRRLRNLLHHFQGQIHSARRSEEETMLYMRVFIVPIEPYLGLEQQFLKEVEKHIRKNSEDSYFNTNSLIVSSTVACPFVKETKTNTTLTFPSTRIGTMAYSQERCYPKHSALGHRLCKGGFDMGATWTNTIMANNCKEIPPLNASTSTPMLRNLSEMVFSESNAQTLLTSAAELTKYNQDLTEVDVNYTASIMFNYQNQNTARTKQDMDLVVNITNNILGIKPSILHYAGLISNAPNRIIKLCDDMASQVNLNQTIENDSLQAIRDHFAFSVWKQSGQNALVIGKGLTKADSETGMRMLSNIILSDDLNMLQTDAAIYISKHVLEGMASRLSVQFYTNTAVFTSPTDRFAIHSHVASARLMMKGRIIKQFQNDSVTAVFRLKQMHENLVCGYWDYAANQDAGGWKTDGCNRSPSENFIVKCTCNHLTNFAVLIDLQAGGNLSNIDEFVLGVITKGGLVVSTVGLSFTILTFIVFRHLRKGRGQQVLVNLSVAMLCSSVLFLVGIERTETRGGCIAVGVLLHYFILVSFMWMLVEGILQYLRFVKVLGTYIPTFMVKSMLASWGMPLIPVIAVLCVDPDLYKNDGSYCWLSGKSLLYAFVLPLAVIIVANTVIFFLIVRQFCVRKKIITASSNRSEHYRSWLQLKAAVSIFIVLGLTWIFGFLTVDDTRIAFHYIFAVLNAFQGFFIFMMFTLREKRIRGAWKRLCCSKMVQMEATSSTRLQRQSNSSEISTTSRCSKKVKSFNLTSIRNHQSEHARLLSNAIDYPESIITTRPSPASNGINLLDKVARVFRLHPGNAGNGRVRTS